MIELAMPAGSMQCALVAFRDGADAIYLGLKSYSARKSAVNFSIDEYSKIYRFAKDNNKKVYVTINTVIYDAQIEKVIKLLKQIQIIGSDGIIVQDLGLAKIIKEHFSDLELHGSTQLAVHSVDGVIAMKNIGFSRVVLSRELSIEEIEKIRIACPDIELKVFIHGALCYGFSGLCMASRIITNRSANAGACAQICRTWFSTKDKDGYFFSMKDLNAGDSIKKLQDINIDSLKVEGRMKSPAYVSAVTKYYRAIIDNKPYKHLLDAVKISFSRESSKAWLDDFNNKDRSSLIVNSYPSHKGVKCAEVLDIVQIRNNYYAYLDLYSDIAIHDGIMYLKKPFNTEIEEPFKFSVNSILDNNYNSIKNSQNLRKVYLLLSDRENSLEIGDSLYLIKKHDQDEKLINTDRLVFTKNYSSANFIIEDDCLIVKSKLRFINEIEIKSSINIEKSNREFDYSKKIEDIFKQSDDSFFEINSINIINNSSLDMKNIFLPLSVIKEMRRNFYKEIEEKLKLFIEASIDFDLNEEKLVLENLPLRKHLNIKRIPFFQIVPTEINELVNIDDKYYLPLPAVFFNEEDQKKNLKIIISKLIEKKLINKVYFGLNNIAHLQWLDPYQVNVFADIYFYLANREAARLLLNTNNRIVGAYLFLETVVGDVSLWPFLPTKVEKDYLPPLFISRSNFNYDSLKNTNIIEDSEIEIYQRDKEYEVITKGDLTYLIKKN